MKCLRVRMLDGVALWVLMSLMLRTIVTIEKAALG